MKKAAFSVALSLSLLLFPIVGFAATIYDNFTGYSDFWHPLGYPNTATYGETFAAPTNGDTSLNSFSFYMGSPDVGGDILLRAYIAEWTGTHAGTLLFTSSNLDYPNTGNSQLTFSTGGLNLNSGAEYVAFLSISELYGQSAGEAKISQGDSTIPGGNFVYYNNSGDFSSLFSTPWDDTSDKPDWAFTASFSGAQSSSVPEPATLVLFGAGLAGLGAIRRRKARKNA